MQRANLAYAGVDEKSLWLNEASAQPYRTTSSPHSRSSKLKPPTNDTIWGFLKGSAVSQNSVELVELVYRSVMMEIMMHTRRIEEFLGIKDDHLRSATRSSEFV